MAVIARIAALARKVAQSRSGATRKRRDAASAAIRATALRRAEFGQQLRHVVGLDAIASLPPRFSLQAKFRSVPAVVNIRQTP
jgi:hypothetical protein